ncbi:MAG: DNA internalization-related competence protein ComEC/Rec2 [Thermodesulfobacteriota bacterium]|nr:DNA internalization-related competence protein ComEC/Rec2 [Thermodesulfobacteriota bacterium]
MNYDQADSARPRALPDLLHWQILLSAFIFGIFCLRFPVPAGAGFLVFCIFVRRRLQTLFAWFVLVFCLGLGFGYAHWRMPVGPEETPQWMLAREKVLIQGRIFELRPKLDERLQIILEDVHFERESGEQGELSGKLVWTWEYPRLRLTPGQDVSVRLRVKPVRGFLNPGIWDSGFYWVRQGVFFRAFARGDKAEVTPGPRPESTFFDLRQNLRRTIVEYAPNTQGRALLLALLLGDRFFLEQETLENFQKASLAHSLALSGMHLGFVAGLGFVLAWVWGLIRPGIFLKIPRPKLAVLFAAPLVLSYVWLGGATPSLVRSCVMFGFWGALLLLNRGRVLIDGLFLALALILLVSPLSAYDIRLQFSAVAVAGIAVLGPVLWRLLYAFVLRRIFPGREDRSWGRVFLGYGIKFFAGLFLLSLCANIALLPLMVWNFGYVTANLWINLFWIPILGMAVIPLGFAGLLLAVFPWSEGLGGIFLHADGVLLQWGVDLLAFFDAQGLLPVLVTLRPKWPQIVGYYALLTGIFVFRRKPLRTLSFVLFAGLFLIAYPGLEQSWRDTGRVSLRMLDVGQSQSLVVEVPGGARTLVDGGGSWSRRFDMGRAVTAPVLTWGRRPVLSWAVMSHPDYDHHRGLIYPLVHFDVRGFAYNGRWPTGEDGEVMRAALRKREIVPLAWYAGHVVSMRDGLSLEVLHPPQNYRPEKDNDASLVLRLVWRGKGLALMPGDLEAKGIKVLLEDGRDLSAEVLVLPHHGSRSSLSPALYDRVNPKYALAAAGYLNYWDFPSLEVREALEARGIPLYTTARHGAVSVVWDEPDGLGVIEAFVREHEE